MPGRGAVCPPPVTRAARPSPRGYFCKEEQGPWGVCAPAVPDDPQISPKSPIVIATAFPVGLPHAGLCRAVKFSARLAGARCVPWDGQSDRSKDRHIARQVIDKSGLFQVGPQGARKRTAMRRAILTATGEGCPKGRALPFASRALARTSRLIPDGPPVEACFGLGVRPGALEPHGQENADRRHPRGRDPRCGGGRKQGRRI